MTLSSMSELEGSQAHLHKPPKLKGAQLTTQGQPPLLFIAPTNEYGRYLFTGRISHRPDAPVELTGRAAPRPIALRRPRGLLDSTATT
jgi:hypothetical protein